MLNPLWLIEAWRRGIGCPLHALTGLPCPGCGATRATLALLRLDLPGALAFNPGAVIGGFVYLGYLAWGARHNLVHGGWPRGPRIPGARWLAMGAFALNWAYLILHAS